MYRCSQCGNLDTLDHEEPYKTCQISGGEPCDACKKMEYLNVQISQARNVLEDLLHERRELKTQVNSHHDTFIRYQMPEEVVSAVFESYVGQLNICSLRNNFHSPLIFGTICRTWRRIAWSTPRLWTTLSFGLGPDKGRKRTRLFLEWLSRSGNLPLSIRVFTVAGLDSQDPDMYSVIETINQHSGRWYFLDLNIPDSFLSHFSDSECDSSILHTIKISSGIERLGIIKATPTNVNIIGGPLLTSVGFRWKNLTHVSAHVLCTDEIMELLSQAPRLLNCEFMIRYGNREDAPLIARYGSAIYPQLKSLNMAFQCESETTDPFFDNISLPGLTSLTFKCPIDEALPTPALVSLLGRSSCSLEKLSLHGQLITGEDVVQLARAAPSLTSLSLFSGTTLGLIMNRPLDAFYHALSAHLWTTSDQPASAEPLLPLLQMFTLNAVHHFPQELVLGLFAPFSKMEGSSQRPFKSVRIHFQYTCEDTDYIDRATLSRLRKLMQEGVSLIIRSYQIDVIERSYQKVKEEDQDNIAPSSNLYITN